MADRGPKDTASFITDLCVRLFWSETEAARPLTNAKLLSLAASVTKTYIWPALKDAREDYTTATLDFAVGNADTDEAGALISLPPESLLQVEAVWYVPATGRQEYQLAHYHENDISRITTGIPQAYYFRGGRLGISPAPSTGYVRVRFSCRACNLVYASTSTANTHRIVASYSGDNITTTAALPTTWVAAEDYLILAAIPPHTPVAWIDKANVISHAGSILEVDSAAQFPSSTKTNKIPVKPGDIIVEGFDIPIIQCPDEAYEFLLWQIVLMVATARGDTARIQSVQPMVSQAYGTFLQSLQPRDVDGDAYIPEDRSLMLGRHTSRWRY